MSNAYIAVVEVVLLRTRGSATDKATKGTIFKRTRATETRVEISRRARETTR